MSVVYLIDDHGVMQGPVALPVIPGLGEQMPENAIALEAVLPNAKAGHVWVWHEHRPTQMEDLRGPVYRTDTGAEERYDQLGPLPSGLTLKERPSPSYCWSKGNWVPNLSYVHQQQTTAINDACSAEITGGFWSSGLGEPHRYSSEQSDQLNLIGVIQRGLDSPYACRDAQGSKEFRLHTAAQLRQVGDDLTVYKLHLLQWADHLKQQLDAALEGSDLPALEAITWTAPV